MTANNGGIPGKRCAHCGTHTTPLWRNGPDGPKTLCNACGVRDNRRQNKNKTRNVAQKLRVKKAPPAASQRANGVMYSKRNGNINSPRDDEKMKFGRPKRKGTNDLENGSSSKANGLTNVTNNNAKLQDSSTPSKGQRATQREINVRIQGFNKDPFAKPKNIHVPSFGKAETAHYYTSLNDGRTYQPPQSYHKSDEGVVAARFGPNTAAATYECDEEDMQWLESQRYEFANNGKKSATTIKKSAGVKKGDKKTKKTKNKNGQETAIIKNANDVPTQEHVEKLFDVFEEASWCASSMVSSNSACDIVLGRCYSPAVPEEDALHWTSDQPMHEAFLVSPPHYKRNDKRYSLPNKYDTWGAVMSGGENSNDATNECLTLPRTPNGDVNVDGDLIGNKQQTTVTTKSKSKLSKVITNSGSENSSECSDEHLTRLEKLSDTNDSDVDNVSGNGSSNDLVVKRVTRSFSNKINRRSLTKVHSKGRAASSKLSATALRLRKACRAAEWVPSAVDVGVGELKMTIQKKTKNNPTRNNKNNNHDDNNINCSNTNSNVSSGAFPAQTRRITRGSKFSFTEPNKLDEASFVPYLLERKVNLTINTSRKVSAAAQGFHTPEKALVVKPNAAMDNAFAELRRKYPHAPSRVVVLKVHHYWYLKRAVRNAGPPLLARFFWVPSKELRKRPELATEAERDKYLFCFDANAVRRKKAEKEDRKIAMLNNGGSLAQKRRRRRACFNPAASKRRRKAKAEMDFATTQPLTICFEPLEDVLEYGLEYVEVGDERYVELMALAEGGTPRNSATNAFNKMRGVTAKSAVPNATNDEGEKTIVGSLMKKMFGWGESRGAAAELDYATRPATPKKSRTPRGAVRVF